MFNKVKEIFGYNNNQKVITIVEKTPVVEEPIIEEERVLDISGPVYIIADKVKQNPKRLVITEYYGISVQGYYMQPDSYLITDKITGNIFKYITGPVPNTSTGFFNEVHNILNKDMKFTQDEIDYLVGELRNFLQDYTKERQKRLTEIKASRKLRQKSLAREKMQREWEES